MNEAALTAWGTAIGQSVSTPVIFALRGDLGAGKSVLARAIARGAGVHAPMPSPTFNLLYRYDSDRGADVIHIDLYRLERMDEVWELGWSELGRDDQIVLIEWPERAEAILPGPRWDIFLDMHTPETRTVRAVRIGDAPDLPPLPDTQ